MNRTFKNNRPFSLVCMSVAIGLIICFVGYLFQYMFFFNPSWKWYFIIIQSVVFIFMYWAFVKVYLTDPGTVPQFYAVQQNSFKQTDGRIYCLICHNFKAQRTHHCSTCQQCILNMDHHCPWLNNCVGYYNRKFFILFLFYLSISLILVIAQQGYLLVIEFIPIFRHQASTTFHTFARILLFLFQITIFFPITIFTGYHFQLVLKNQTTLSQLKKQRDEKRNKQKQQRDIKIEQNVYDIGNYRNFTQVFGKRFWQWLLPITGTLSCDGLNWPKNTYSKIY